MRLLRFLSLFLCLMLAGAIPARAQNGASGQQIDPQLIHGILDVLNDAVITRLDARVSLEGATVKRARVRLENLVLRDLDIGVRLNARGARKLAALVGNQNSSNELAPLLELARLGLFNRIEISIGLRELSLRNLAVDADDLDVEGLLLQVGATPPDSQGRVRSDTLAQVLEILRHTALNKVKAHAGLDKLAAKRIKVGLRGLSLEGFYIKAALIREDNSEPVSE